MKSMQGVQRVEGCGHLDLVLQRGCVFVLDVAMVLLLLVVCLTL
jgi:hypothetical protein